MASLCLQHSGSTQGSQDLTFDSELGHFALAPVGGSGAGEARASEGAGAGGEASESGEDGVNPFGLMEGEVVDLDESFGFSDSDSEAVIELSSEEEGEGEEQSEEPGVSQLKTHMLELRLSDMGSGDEILSLSTDSDRDLEIEQLKVSWLPCLCSCQ